MFFDWLIDTADFTLQLRWLQNTDLFISCILLGLYLNLQESNRVVGNSTIEKLNNFYSSPNTYIIRIIKSRKIKWVAHVARI
jgi:hypothetical protein